MRSSREKIRPLIEEDRCGIVRRDENKLIDKFCLARKALDDNNMDEARTFLELLIDMTRFNNVFDDVTLWPT